VCRTVALPAWPNSLFLFPHARPRWPCSSLRHAALPAPKRSMVVAMSALQAGSRQQRTPERRVQIVTACRVQRQLLVHKWTYLQTPARAPTGTHLQASTGKWMRQGSKVYGCWRTIRAHSPRLLTLKGHMRADPSAPHAMRVLPWSAWSMFQDRLRAGVCAHVCVKPCAHTFT